MTRVLLLFTIALALAAGPLLASSPGPQPECEDPTGFLGIAGLSCEGPCSFRGDDGLRSWRFAAEPVITGVAAPAERKLRRGDLLVSVDGRLITTEAGGDRLARVEIGETVPVTVRRGEVLVTVDLTAVPRCRPDGVSPAPRPPRAPGPVRSPRAVPSPEAPGAPSAPSAAPSPEARPAPAAPGSPPTPAAPAATPRPEAPPAPAAPAPPPPPPAGGGLGFAFSCDGCQVTDDPAGRHWRFSEPPRVESVEPGSAASRAGLIRGDFLLEVDGEDVTTAAGGRAFAGLADGTARSVLIRRGSNERRFGLPTAAPTAAPSAAPAPRSEALRYTGSLGPVTIEVRGAPINAIEVRGPVEGSHGEELILRTREQEIRLRLTEDPAPERTGADGERRVSVERRVVEARSGGGG